MITNLPTELLRSFAAIVDSGSMTKATERIFVTQSALSLQIKRLEALVQSPLFLRDGSRRMVLSKVGHEMLAYARQILDLNDQAVTSLRNVALAGPVRVGVSQDFTEVLLTGVFRHFLQQNEDVRLEVRTAEAPELLNGFRDGDLDIVLTVASGDGDAAIVRRAETMWIGHSRLADEPELPLVLLDQPCPFRNAALRTLERSGKPYRIVVQTPHLLDLYAAVAGGLGVTCRTALFMLGNSTLAIRSSQLPHLPQIAYALYARSPGSPAVAWLDKMMRQAVTDMP